MFLHFNHFHHLTEEFEVGSFWGELKFILLEERNDYLDKIIAIIDLISITMLVIGTAIFLKIDASTTKVLLQSIQYFLVLFDELDVEFWFYRHSSLLGTRQSWITNVDREASFTVYKTCNVIWVKIMHVSEPFIRPLGRGYYGSADFWRCVSFIILPHSRK